MNCQSCPYQKQIEALRCRCLACNPDSTGGRPHGIVSANDYTLNAVGKHVDFDMTPSAKATHLSEDDENKLRIAMSSLFGLDPIDLLLVQHLIRGGSLESFMDTMKPTAAKIEKYRGSSRAVAWARKMRLMRKMPILAPVLKTARENDAAGRVMGEMGLTLGVGTPEET